MKTGLMMVFLLMVGVSYGQLKVTQPIRYYKLATYDVSPTIPVAVGANKAVQKAQLDSLKSDTISIRRYISGSTGKLAYFATDSTLRIVTGGTEGQVLKISGGVPAWVTP